MNSEFLKSCKCHTNRDGKLVVLCAKFGSFDWPTYLEFDGKNYKFNSQGAFDGQDSHNFGGKAFYDFVSEEDMPKRKDLNRIYVNYLSLEESGYKKGPSSFKTGASALFQKRVKKNGKTLYFINVYEYDFTKFRGHGYQGPDLGYHAEVRFYLKDGIQFSAELPFLQKVSVKDMEAFFEKTYNRMECVPDQDNND